MPGASLATRRVGAQQKPPVWAGGVRGHRSPTPYAHAILAFARRTPYGLGKNRTIKV